MQFSVTCILEDEKKVSHFAEAVVPLRDGGTIGALSEAVSVTGVIFRETPGDYDFDWHPAPRRQFIVLLEGEIAIETGDGAQRILRAGEVL